MLYGASTTLLMAELTLFRLEIQSMHPRFKAWSATRPTLAPDGLAQICCNLCTAVVCLTAAPLSAGQGVTADLVSDKANLVIRQCCMQDLNGTDKTSFFIALCCFLFFQIRTVLFCWWSYCWFRISILINVLTRMFSIEILLCISKQFNWLTARSCRIFLLFTALWLGQGGREEPGGHFPSININ